MNTLTNLLRYYVLPYQDSKETVPELTPSPTLAKDVKKHTSGASKIPIPATENQAPVSRINGRNVNVAGNGWEYVDSYMVIDALWGQISKDCTASTILQIKESLASKKYTLTKKSFLQWINGKCIEEGKHSIQSRQKNMIEALYKFVSSCKKSNSTKDKDCLNIYKIIKETLIDLCMDTAKGIIIKGPMALTNDEEIEFLKLLAIYPLEKEVDKKKVAEQYIKDHKRSPTKASYFDNNRPVLNPAAEILKQKSLLSSANETNQQKDPDLLRFVNIDNFCNLFFNKDSETQAYEKLRLVIAQLLSQTSIACIMTFLKNHIETHFTESLGMLFAGDIPESQTFSATFERLDDRLSYSLTGHLKSYRITSEYLGDSPRDVGNPITIRATVDIDPKTLKMKMIELKLDIDDGEHKKEASAVGALIKNSEVNYHSCNQNNQLQLQH